MYIYSDMFNPGNSRQNALLITGPVRDTYGNYCETSCVNYRISQVYSNFSKVNADSPNICLVH